MWSYSIDLRVYEHWWPRKATRMGVVFFINGSSIRTQDFILAWQTLDHEADVLNKFQKRVPKLCWNVELWLDDVPSHMTNQSALF